MQYESQGQKKAPLELATASRYYYQAWEVTGEGYDDVEIGGEFKGGTVVDGLCDGETNALIIVTRHESEPATSICTSMPGSEWRKLHRKAFPHGQDVEG